MTLSDERLQKARHLLSVWAAEFTSPDAHRLDAVVEPGNLIAAVKALDEARWGYLACITGVDLGTEAELFEVLYHFCSGMSVMTLRVRTRREQPLVPSISEILPPASFYERELHEMLGVEVAGLTNPDHLFLPDDWPEGVFPLRKDATLP